MSLSPDEQVARDHAVLTLGLAVLSAMHQSAPTTATAAAITRAARLRIKLTLSGADAVADLNRTWIDGLEAGLREAGYDVDAVVDHVAPAIQLFHMGRMDAVLDLADC